MGTLGQIVSEKLGVALVALALILLALVVLTSNLLSYVLGKLLAILDYINLLAITATLFFIILVAIALPMKESKEKYTGEI